MSRLARRTLTGSLRSLSFLEQSIEGKSVLGLAELEIFAVTVPVSAVVAKHSKRFPSRLIYLARRGYIVLVWYLRNDLLIDGKSRRHGRYQEEMVLGDEKLIHMYVKLPGS